jgi:hypothetical protein
MIPVIENATDLDVVCLELARTIKWNQRPVDADEILRLADRLALIARGQVYAPLDRDVALVARAVHYLTNAHGMPMGEDTKWFSETLRAVLEVARPNSGQDGKGREFLRDMLEGIESSLDDE